MTVSDEGITLGERRIPWPQSISPAARAALQAAAMRASPPYPDADDIDGWHRLIAEVNAGMAALYKRSGAGIPVETATLAGAVVHRARPAGLKADDRRLYLDLHGGGLVFGSGDFCKAGAVHAAELHGVESLAVDYRMPPDHPYPAGLDDCLAAYAVEVERRGAQNIVVGGGSAGAYFAAALLLRARDEGLPMPAGAVLLTPKLDMTESGDTFETLMGLDAVLQRRLTECIEIYAGGADLTHRYLSPLFGDVSAFPPTLLQSGTRDLYLSNAVRMHRKLRQAGVAAELHVFEAMPHGGFFAGPEDEDKDAEIAQFVAARWPAR
jgi:monoterpene epsilon-lactone hydrolase